VALIKPLVSWVQESTTQSIGHQDPEHSIIGIMINWSIRAIIHTVCITYTTDDFVQRSVPIIELYLYFFFTFSEQMEC